MQGIGTGNPGYSITLEKNLQTSVKGSLNLFGGIGFRSNESHGHFVGGMKYSWDNFAVGLQHDGHQSYPFVTYTKGKSTLGLYLVEGKRPAYLAGIRF